MQQIAIDEDLIVPLDYDSPELSRAVRQFKPTLYKDGDAFACILGPDSEQAVYGQGITEDEALKNWEADFKSRLKSKGDNDEVAQYIKDTLAISKKDVW
ncbi:MAG TPA: hypothetical protein VJU78_15195 [Chitinophagaceae bacterium]|nr:hypothetical protein [Chitinophagaceae bacterium]